MKPSQIARIDAATPRWPLARVSLTAPPAIELAGISTPLDTADPHGDAHQRVLDEARYRGHDLRMEVRNGDGTVDRFIVRTDGTLIALDHARPASRARAQSARATAATTEPQLTPPDRRRRWLTWGGAIMGVLVVASIVVLIVDPQGADGQHRQATPQAPVPSPAQLYTEQPPPGWDAEAAWALPIAKNSTVALDADSGTLAVLTPDDRSSAAAASESAGDVDARKPNYLSVLDADGSTKFAVELDGAPSAGPAITTIDGDRVVALVSGSTLSYWPLEGPGADQVDVDLSAKNAASIDLSEHGVLVEISDTKLATIGGDELVHIEALPLTTPIAMTPDGALSIEESTGSWWLTAPDSEPTEIAPDAPAGATGYSSTICADPEHVIVLWESDAPTAASYKKPGILAGYQTQTGELVATAAVDSLAENKTASCAASPLRGLTAGNGFVLLDAGAQSSLTVVPGLHTDTVQDAVYGTIDGEEVHIAADGALTPQPDSALTPVAGADDRLYVISQSQLYALEPR